MSDSDRIKLAQMIQDSGMVRLDVSKYLGIHERTLYRYLSGETEIPAMLMLAMELLLKSK